MPRPCARRRAHGRGPRGPVVVSWPVRAGGDRGGRKVRTGWSVRPLAGNGRSSLRRPPVDPGRGRAGPGPRRVRRRTGRRPPCRARTPGPARSPRHRSRRTPRGAALVEAAAIERASARADRADRTRDPSGSRRALRRPGSRPLPGPGRRFGYEPWWPGGSRAVARCGPAGADHRRSDTRPSRGPQAVPAPDASVDRTGSNRDGSRPHEARRRCRAGEGGRARRARARTPGRMPGPTSCTPGGPGPGGRPPSRSVYRRPRP